MALANNKPLALQCLNNYSLHTLGMCACKSTANFLDAFNGDEFINRSGNTLMARSVSIPLCSLRTKQRDNSVSVTNLSNNITKLCLVHYCLPDTFYLQHASTWSFQLRTIIWDDVTYITWLYLKPAPVFIPQWRSCNKTASCKRPSVSEPATAINHWVTGSLHIKHYVE